MYQFDISTSAGAERRALSGARARARRRSRLEAGQRGSLGRHVRDKEARVPWQWESTRPARRTIKREARVSRGGCRKRYRVPDSKPRTSESAGRVGGGSASGRREGSRLGAWRGKLRAVAVVRRLGPPPLVCPSRKRSRRPRGPVSQPCPLRPRTSWQWPSVVAAGRSTLTDQRSASSQTHLGPAAGHAGHGPATTAPASGAPATWSRLLVECLRGARRSEQGRAGSASALAQQEQRLPCRQIRALCLCAWPAWPALSARQHAGTPAVASGGRVR